MSSSEMGTRWLMVTSSRCRGLGTRRCRMSVEGEVHGRDLDEPTLISHSSRPHPRQPTSDRGCVMEVRNIRWVWIATDRYTAMITLFRDVIGLPVNSEDSTTVEFPTSARSAQSPVAGSLRPPTAQFLGTALQRRSVNTAASSTPAAMASAVHQRSALPQAAPERFGNSGMRSGYGFTSAKNTTVGMMSSAAVLPGEDTPLDRRQVT
jgi:hypothetical protein